MTNVRFIDASTGTMLEVAVQRVLIAGFTGRDATAVQAHVDELAALGVPVPSSIPAVYEVPVDLLTTGEEIEVDGTFTSGEVEPVLVCHGGRRWLTVGSDHTDRDEERRSIEDSKRACPHVVSSTLLPLKGNDDLDTVTLESWVNDEEEHYQKGTMAQIRPLPDLLATLETHGVRGEDGDVVFLGTLPVSGELRPSKVFRGTLRQPASGLGAEVGYKVTIRGSGKHEDAET